MSDSPSLATLAPFLPRNHYKIAKIWIRTLPWHATLGQLPMLKHTTHQQIFFYTLYQRQAMIHPSSLHPHHCHHLEKSKTKIGDYPPSLSQSHLDNNITSCGTRHSCFSDQGELNTLSNSCTNEHPKDPYIL